MRKVRRAVLIASAERYVVMAVNFVVLAVIARLLTPEEVGLSVIGLAALAVIDPLRDWASAYFIWQKDVTREDSRTVFTIMLLVSVFCATVLVMLAGPLAAFYQHDGLAFFWYVLAVALLAGPFERPIMALLQREMAFSTIAGIRIGAALINATAAIAFAALGFGFMSFAWAFLIAAACGVALVVYARPDWWIFRPLMSEWRSAVAFGGYNTVIALLSKTYETIPYLVLARVHSFDAVGLFNRAAAVSHIPDKTLLAALTPVALPAFASQAREGRSLKQPYLRGIEYLTGLQWPALALLAFLAHPIVIIVLGQQWLGVVPFVRILALAAFISFPLGLTSPVLLSLASIRELLAASLLALPVCAVVVSLGAWFGLEALAFSGFLVNTLQAYVALRYVRRHVFFRWRELGAALQKSAIVTTCSMLGPTVAVGLWGLELSLGAAGIAAMMAGIGWLIGLLVTRHPLLLEIRDASAVLTGQYPRAT
jgi:O-antigen/teichoic acid export membrane protein